LEKKSNLPMNELHREIYQTAIDTAADFGGF
jgi:hypothetical protein